MRAGMVVGTVGVARCARPKGLLGLCLVGWVRGEVEVCGSGVGAERCSERCVEVVCV